MTCDLTAIRFMPVPASHGRNDETTTCAEAPPAVKCPLLDQTFLSRMPAPKAAGPRHDAEVTAKVFTVITFPQSSSSLWGLAGMTGNSRHCHDQRPAAYYFNCLFSCSLGSMHTTVHGQYLHLAGSLHADSFYHQRLTSHLWVIESTFSPLGEAGGNDWVFSGVPMINA